MKALTLLREQFTWAHDTLEGTVADLTQDGSDFNILGKAIPAGAAYAHAVLSEDMMLSMLAKKETVFKDAARVGLSESMPGMENWARDHENWYLSVKVDIAKFKKYAQEVYAATDAYVAGLTEADLDKETEMSGMKQPLAFFLSNFFILHIANLTGEISAAKGVQGLKGYPW